MGRRWGLSRASLSSAGQHRPASLALFQSRVIRKIPQSSRPTVDPLEGLEGSPSVRISRGAPAAIRATWRGPARIVWPIRARAAGLFSSLPKLPKWPGQLFSVARAGWADQWEITPEEILAWIAEQEAAA